MTLALSSSHPPSRTTAAERHTQGHQHASRAHQSLRNSLPPRVLSFPSYHFGVAEAPQRVRILGPSTPVRGNSLQFGTGGKAVFQRFLANVRVQGAVGVGIGPFPRCGPVGVGHGRWAKAFAKVSQ
jgi:hypothetical protein